MDFYCPDAKRFIRAEQISQITGHMAGGGAMAKKNKTSFSLTSLWLLGAKHQVAFEMEIIAKTI